LSVPRRTKRRRDDVPGRIFLGLLGTLLIVFGLSRSDEFAGLPLIFLGALLAILAGFHSRIGGAIGIGKFQVPIVPEHDREKAEPPAGPAAGVAEPDGSGHRPSLREVRSAAERPATDRGRDE
jgi:hypothetical protein